MSGRVKWKRKRPPVCKGWETVSASKRWGTGHRSENIEGKNKESLRFISGLICPFLNEKVVETENGFTKLEFHYVKIPCRTLRAFARVWARETAEICKFDEIKNRRSTFRDDFSIFRASAFSRCTEWSIRRRLYSIVDEKINFIFLIWCWLSEITFMVEMYPIAPEDVFGNRKKYRPVWQVSAIQK